jgi:hypothetical protein
VRQVINLYTIIAFALGVVLAGQVKSLAGKAKAKTTG